MELFKALYREKTGLFKALLKKCTSTMKCNRCSQKAVFLQPTLCKTHFLHFVEKKVDATIKKYNLITKKDKIVVAVSGGKDSLTVLSILRKYNKNLLALCIDEGIAGYREHTVKDMKQFCERHTIPYMIVSYKKEFGMSLDEMLTKLKEKPCTVCGIFRRYFLNKKARELHATKLATGHNADDEAQAVLMNLFRHQLDVLPRLGPRTGVIQDTLFIPRIKPLYEVTEKETAAYAFLQGFSIRFTECPHSTRAYRGEVGEFLNDIENKYKGSKKRMLQWFLTQLPSLKKTVPQAPVQHCASCHEPCMQKICKACHYLIKLGCIQGV